MAGRERRRNEIFTIYKKATGTISHFETWSLLKTEKGHQLCLRNVQPSMIRKCTQRREDEHEGQLRPSLFRSLHSPRRPLRPLKKGGDVLGSRPFPLQEMQLRRREKEEDTIWVRFPVPSADVIGKCFQKASTRRCFECTE